MLESLCHRHRPAAASEGQAKLRGGTLRKKQSSRQRSAIPGALCHALCAFASRLIAALAGNRPAPAPHSWALPPLIKDAAEPPGWLGAMRGLVEPAQPKKRKTQKVPILAASERPAENCWCNDCH